MIFRLIVLCVLLVGCSTVEEVEQKELADPPKGHSDIQPPGEMPPAPRKTKYEGFVGVTIDTMMKKGDEAFQSGNYSEASKHYKNVMELQKATPGGRAAEALYKMGLCEELLGEDERAIAKYQDALKRRKDLTFELAQMEIPARLAMAYMRIGQMKTAKGYFLKAEKGIAKLRANLTAYQDKSQWLAEILYGMGFISAQIKNDKNFDDTIYSIQHAQNYLLFAIEINDPKWSPMAGKEMEKLYKAALENINSMTLEKSKDSVVAERKLQEKKKSMSYTLLDQIANLQDLVLPEVENSILKQTLVNLSETEKALDAIVKSRPVGEGLTDEAKKFENPKREGRIKDE